MKRIVGFGLAWVMLVTVLVGCGKATVVADWFPETLSEEYGMDEKTYFSKERDVSNMPLPEGVEVGLDGAKLVWTQEGKTHLLAQLPQRRDWQKIAAVTQVGVMVQSNTGLWLAAFTGEVRNLQFLGSDQIEGYAIGEPYYYFAERGEVYRGRLDTDLIEKVGHMGKNGTIVRMRLASSVDLELTIRVREGSVSEVTIGYCMVTQKTYDYSPITDRVQYLEARNKDMIRLGRSLAEFSYGFQKPKPLQPIDEAPSMWTPPTDMTDAEYLAVERTEDTHQRQYYTYSVENNTLLYTPIGAKSALPSLGDLGEGVWRTVGGENEVGQLLFEAVNGELWMYEKATGYRYWIGKVGEIQEYTPYGPHYFLVCKDAVYRGSILSKTLREVCRKDEREDVVVWSNDVVQLFLANGKNRIISLHTGKEYRVSVQMHEGWLETDLETFYRMRRADLDRMGLTEEFFVTKDTDGSDPFIKKDEA